MKDDMYVERVLLPRPNFFKEVPPRILDELSTHSIENSTHVDNHGVEYSSEKTAVPNDEDGTLGMKNASNMTGWTMLENAVKILGTRNEMNGKSHLVTYQPVWEESRKRCAYIVKMNAAKNKSSAKPGAENTSAPSHDSLTVDSSFANTINDNSSTDVAVGVSPPLTNFERTGGCVPLFGCDDPSLPSEADLGIFATAEEENRTIARRTQEKEIEKNTVADIFGPMLCPSPAHGPDDSVTRNPRAVSSPTVSLEHTYDKDNSTVQNDTSENRNDYTDTSINAINETNPVIENDQASPPKQSSLTQKQSQTQSTIGATNGGQSTKTGNDQSTRNGWWNTSSDSNLPKVKNYVYIQDGPKPTMKELNDSNLPLSYLPPSTSTIQSLPYVSDRSPSFRHIQIDPATVTFACGLIEPLFCTLSIYHIEMDDNLSSSSNVGETSESMKDTNISPRCGKVTESIHFDYYPNAKDIQNAFAKALWPYRNMENHQNLIGSKSGVFPIPSNFNIANLYVVLIVKKVLSEDADLEPYLKSLQSSSSPSSPTQTSQHTTHDIGKYKQKAKKASERFGHILTPFAFGVIALEHVIKDVTPKTLYTMLIKVPLIKFEKGSGDKVIIEYIINRFLLSQSVGEMTNGGYACLLLRYLGNLGLNSAIKNNTKSISYNRLVDFSNESQIIRKIKSTQDAESDNYYPWSEEFINTPTQNGGRTTQAHFNNNKGGTNNSAKSTINNTNHGDDDNGPYVQEVAPLPLSYNSRQENNQAYRKNAKTMQFDIEPFYHTAIYNELICHPYRLHNCLKRNVVIQIRIVKFVYNNELSAHIAIPLSTPMIHNSRRGPHLVDEAYTSCLYHTIDPYFLDEFKIKLPLVLDRGLSIMFSVFNLRVKGKRNLIKSMYYNKIKNPLSPTSSIDSQDNEDEDDYVSKNESVRSVENAYLEPLGCGILNICMEDNVLIENNLHDVEIKFVSTPLEEKLESTYSSPLGSEGSFGSNSRRFFGNASQNLSTSSQSKSEKYSKLNLPKGTLVLEPLVREYTRSSKASKNSFDELDQTAVSSKSHAIILQSRTISLSSIHTQHKPLSDFFRYSPPAPRSISENRLNSLPWNLSREEIMYEMSILKDKEPSQAESMILECNNNMLKCPQSELVSHCVRIASQLLRTVVSGTGKPSLLWADPSALIPLRLNSFSSLLTVLKAVLGYQTRQGMTKLDGRGKIDQINISKIVSLIFDDEIIFGDHDEGIFDDENEQDILKEDTFGTSHRSSMKKATLMKSKSVGSKPLGASHSEEEMDNHFSEFTVQGDGGSVIEVNRNITREGINSNSNGGLNPISNMKGLNHSKLSISHNTYDTDITLSSSRQSDNANLVDLHNPGLDPKLLFMSENTNKKEHYPSTSSNATFDELDTISNVKVEGTDNTQDITESIDYNSNKAESSLMLEAQNNIFASWISQEAGHDDNASNSDEDIDQIETHAKNKKTNLEKKIEVSSDMIGISDSDVNNKKVSDKRLEEKNRFDPVTFALPCSPSSSPSSSPNPSQPRLDTKFDFQSALNSYSSSNDDDIRMTRPKANIPSMRGFGDVGSFSFRRRTLTHMGLATIQEDTEAKKNMNGEEMNSISLGGMELGQEENRMTSTELNLQLGEPLKTKKDAEDTVSMFRKSSGGGKQFRIPILDKPTNEETPSSSGSSSDKKIGTHNDQFSQLKTRNSTLPQTKRELEEIDINFLEDNFSLDVNNKDTPNMEEKRLNSLSSSSNASREKNKTEAQEAPHSSSKMKNVTTPKTSEAMERAFLDELEKNLGFGFAGKDFGAEGNLVGHAHHRKHRFGSSISFELPQLDLITENLLEDHMNPFGSEMGENENRNSSLLFKQPIRTDRFSPHRKDLIILKGFPDRILSLSKQMKSGRWFPYLYEVIIFQWVEILREQTKRKNQTSSNMSASSVGSSSVESKSKKQSTGTSNISRLGDKSLTKLSKKMLGLTITSAPILFELIKKSLGFRLEAIRRQRRLNWKKNKHSRKWDKRNRSNSVTFMPDQKFSSTLEKLVCIVTDACIDSRNFDRQTYKKFSYDVNDAIVRFLRDLFAYFDLEFVHKLILIYFSRYAVKDGKHWLDRDVCSYEICKLRLHAVAVFVRFPEFVRVNFPLAETWNKKSFSGSHYSSNNFYSDALDEMESLGMASFAASDGPVRRPALDIPVLNPHWLAELTTDVCLAAMEHKEPLLRLKASSLLLEMFWTQSQEGKSCGTSSIIASMYVPFIVKFLGHINHLSHYPNKHQMRVDIFPCVIFVMQSAPQGLLRALWRKLLRKAEGRGSDPKYGGIGVKAASNTTNINSEQSFFLNHTLPSVKGDESAKSSSFFDSNQSILDVFSLLNLAMKTFEYEKDYSIEEVEKDSFSKEFVLSEELEQVNVLNSHTALNYKTRKGNQDTDEKEAKPKLNTKNSRKWYAHDGAKVIINTSRYIVNEALYLLKLDAKSNEKERADVKPSFEQPKSSIFNDGRTSGMSNNNRKKHRHNRTNSERNFEEKYNMGSEKPLCFSTQDITIFSRAALSLYLNTLSLNQSDIVIIKTFSATIEIVKIFGVQNFFTAVGETFQHWLRVVILHCGARRGDLRSAALEFLVLILRLTWDSYGSLFRVRIPLLAIQSEVMDRIVVIAATKYYREQRKMQVPVEQLSNEAAEGSLAMLWRTLDRLEKNSVSENVAFRTAQMRLAKTMKTLFRAYIAANALAISSRNRSTVSDTTSTNISSSTKGNTISQVDIRLRSIISKSGYCRQFVRLFSKKQSEIHNEAVEAAFLAAAYVFSPTELPMLRVAWLRKLANYHAFRKKYAEEASCHFHIYVTLREAARLHDSIWNSVPFLPWTYEVIHLDGEGPAGEEIDDQKTLSPYEDISVDGSFSTTEIDSGKYFNSFRRLFYRVPGSLRAPSGEWDVTGKTTAFYGATNSSEYCAINSSSNISVKELEEEMVEAAEIAGKLFLREGVVENSRCAWNLATQFYSYTYNYAKLSDVYGRLAKAVESKVPVVDTSSQLDFSSSLGRFYRVWFHGGAPDELIGKDFVYRTSVNVNLEEFGNDIKQVIKSLLPEQTPIDLVLDDGRPEEPPKRTNKIRITSGSTIEAIKIKVTPLRPMIKGEKHLRGSPEWFNNYIETPDVMHKSKFSSQKTAGYDRGIQRFNSPHQRGSYRTGGNDYRLFGATDGLSLKKNQMKGTLSHSIEGDSASLIGTDQFHYIQPDKNHRRLGNRDYLKFPGDFAEKNLRVTYLQVEECFPACASRQVVKNRTVSFQSPLEAGVEAVCTWCALLFRTVIASNGMAVLGMSTDDGIGMDVTKVVAELIHSGRIKDMGQHLLNKNRYVPEEDVATERITMGSLSEQEISRHQVKLARGIVIYMELLHLLIVRNRVLLLRLISERKQSRQGSKRSTYSARTPPNPSSPQSMTISVISSEDSAGDYSSLLRNQNYTTFSLSSVTHMDRTDRAMAVQRELQRSFLSMSKVLYPIITNIIYGETPRWLRLCSRTDGYFSSGSYRHTRISFEEELVFPNHNNSSKTFPNFINAFSNRLASPIGSYTESVVSRNSESKKRPHRRHQTASSLASSIHK